jgi:hypothetical protein
VILIDIKRRRLEIALAVGDGALGEFGISSSSAGWLATGCAELRRAMPR